MTMLMYDSVTYWRIPTTAPVVCGWNSGPYKWSPTAWSLFPTPFKLTATPFSTTTADVYDCEKGTFPITAIPGILNRFGRKIIYISKSNWTTAKSLTQNLPCYWWVADWTNTPHLIPTSIATQWMDNQTLYDISTITYQFILNYFGVETTMPVIGTGYMVFTGLTKTNHKLAFIVENSQHTDNAAWSIIDLGDLAVQKQVLKTAEFVD